MRALVASYEGARMVHRPALPAPAPTDVKIAVRMAGICRTDRYAARCQLDCPPGRILGHEFAGIVTAVGTRVTDIQLGTRVSVNPLLPCLRCASCTEGRAMACEAPQFLGVDLDGAFTEEIIVPQTAVFPVPDVLSWAEAAYVEPVAAALAVCDAPLSRETRGLIVGDGRIATLTERVLSAHNFQDIIVASSADAHHMTDRFAFVIETNAATDGLCDILDRVEWGGTVVLKSRPAAPIRLDLARAVSRRLQLVGVHYGDFSAAIDLIAGGRLEIGDLLGPEYPLSAHERAFAEDNGRLKRFLVPDGGLGE